MGSRRRHTALGAALAGASLQVIDEAGHAWSHLRMAPEALVPGMLSLVGLVVAVIALVVHWRHRRRTAQPAAGSRSRAA